MEMGSDEKVGLMRKGFEWVKGLVGKLGEVRSKAIALGKDDPRRVIHSLKLGLALTIVSILYYYNPLYANFGVSAMWAVMTVVVVFEFSVGATLRKGLNRTFATLFAGALGAGAHYLAALSGHVGQPIITSIFVFLLVWAGQDLHNRIALNIENLAIFLEGYGSVECLKSLQDEQFTQEYKSILKSSGIEETLYNSARWEPGHGCFQFRHPWNQYLKIGALTSQCAFRIDALCRNLSSSNIQVSQKIQTEIQETCMEMSMESGKALRQLVSSIRELTQPTQAQIYTQNSKSAAKRLKTSLRSSDFWEDCDFLTLVPAATVGLLLVDVVECTEKISEAVQELASLAHFKSGKAEAMQSEKEKVQPNIGVSFVTIPISSV
ncbi:aluminum-activated malate transporter 7-like isoform X2 [Cucurbita moschata]|uniref:Aluminum-activated malate transporter 7-like isoform X2 n=1 Tax=Cucurbita moschata TaxID=3662 RepID=A0A6J1ES38_CUCMO|nr:aluminum-activated malate transporter 7-like isoform X2 [Cucurbita moschata]